MGGGGVEKMCTRRGHFMGRGCVLGGGDFIWGGGGHLSWGQRLVLRGKISAGGRRGNLYLGGKHAD